MVNPIPHDRVARGYSRTSPPELSCQSNHFFFLLYVPALAPRAVARASSDSKATFLRPVFSRAPSTVRVIPQRRNWKNRCGSWACISTFVVSLVMAVNSSHIKGRGSGQTASVHPFHSSAAQRFGKPRAVGTALTVKNSTDHSPQVRTSSDSKFAKPHAVVTRLY
ncbi:hypothetical protein AVEN_170765-1 [Araneus ventricosus]|uniref:Uncharacterized protein n=1 Tax=Araneus ventricosus TaxID=182803 RepID=A0A4Y1ZS60_ARAVE|nr:hypothetical protein AVEN_170765-1 [Araneus ventricosus]